MSHLPTLLPLGDSAWTVEFGDRIDPALHARVMGLNVALHVARDAGDLAGIVDLVPTFRSLTVHYDPLAVDGQLLGTRLLQMAEAAGSTASEGRHWLLPVCCDADLAPDLERLAEAKGMEPAQVIALLTAATYRVYMIGFMPGFPYMGGLPGVLEVPRLATPRKAVPARSLAIAGAMCAVYPWESPGGWRLLGRTPVPMFDAADALQPALLAAGDRVAWQAIDRPLFLQMEAAASAGEFNRDELLTAPGGD